MDSLFNFQAFTSGYKSVPKTWMSATGLRPLLLGDPVLLWLEHHGPIYGFAKDPEEHSFLGWIGQKGREFEAAIVRHHAPHAVQVLDEDYDVRDVGAFMKTWQALTQGHEVLTKCALWGGDQAKIYGTADIIAKNTWVYNTWPHLRPAEEEPEHYCILDAKFMTKLQTPDKKTELTMASSQVRLYSWILGHIQGFMPPRAFLICRDGVVPVSVGHTLGAPLDPELAALRDRHLDIKLNGADYLPWRDAVVAPGWSNDKDEPWSGAKKRIGAEFIPGRPLHWLPRVGDRQVAALAFHGVRCLDDLLAIDPHRFPFEDIPGLGAKTCPQVRAVLQANRSGQPSLVPARAVPPSKSVELFVDFEFVSSLNVRFDDPGSGMGLLDLTGREMVFQAGCGWEEDGQWKFRCFTAAREDSASERRMLEGFLGFLSEKGAFGGDAALYHWSHAEVGQAKRAAERTGLDLLTRLAWVDVQKSFHDGPIALPGAWAFDLKSIAKALGTHSPAHAVDYPTQLADGLSAMVLAWEAYARENPQESAEMQLIERYLEVDCQSLWQVLRWLRASASGPQKAEAAPHWYVPERAPKRRGPGKGGAPGKRSKPKQRGGPRKRGRSRRSGAEGGWYRAGVLTAWPDAASDSWFLPMP